jgi:hypothetical protein
VEDCTLDCCRRLGWLIVASISLAHALPAQADEGGVIGWVESTRGVPVSGALVSVFGKGLRGGNLITQSDSHGQFVLPALPPGSYTVRAVGSGHQPSAVQRIEVVANRDSLFTLSLTPDGETKPQPAASESQAQREWRWLMRHKRRSVLETSEHEARTASAPRLSLDLPAAPAGDLGMLDGNFELVAASGAAAAIEGSGLPGGLGALRLAGRLTGGVRWTLGGLVAENEGRLWRTAAQFVIEPGGAHTIEAGAGYGAATTRGLLEATLPQPERAMGAVFLKDRWRATDRFSATAGARYTYVGFLPSSHHADAVLEVELQGDRNTVLRGSIITRTLTPGGDLLTLSTVAASPAITWARLDGASRPSRTLHGAVGVQRSFGATQLSAQLFEERTSDLLLTTFAGNSPAVRNAGSMRARGFGVRLGHRVGPVGGSVSYTFGRRSGSTQPGVPPELAEDAEFHDVVARLDAMLDATETRLSALYRVDTIAVMDPGAARRNTNPSNRFDVQLTQGLPFLQPLTRADWEVLFAVRNMFYEASEEAFLDELAVQEPPTRVVGGISVRF